MAQKPVAVNYAGKTVTVYTTADNSNFLLLQNSQAVFTELAQPTEGEVSVFQEIPDPFYKAGDGCCRR